jgi:acyl carrier protein
VTPTEFVLRRIVGELARRHPEDGDVLVMTWVDLGLDSLDVLELAERCEEQLGIAIPDRVLAWCHTPGELATRLSAGPERGDSVDRGVVGVGTG